MKNKARTRMGGMERIDQPTIRSILLIRVLTQPHLRLSHQF